MGIILIMFCSPWKFNLYPDDTEPSSLFTCCYDPFSSGYTYGYVLRYHGLPLVWCLKLPMIMHEHKPSNLPENDPGSLTFCQGHSQASSKVCGREASHYQAIKNNGSLFFFASVWSRIPTHYSSLPFPSERGLRDGQSLILASMPV